MSRDVPLPLLLERGALRFHRSVPGNPTGPRSGGNPGDVGRRGRVQDLEDDSSSEEGDEEEDPDSSPRRQETDVFDNPDQDEAA